ncbi:hypothetical protein K466DRAFT_562519 [Polyporus arcularius HHB13444]|uniref:Uncharacterized protein n=1 Tax=Polyporus arcularius HHB13444 TaxID=1314778 RepID=A0A5C3PR73_9APHY|nr:hypothetical protein K466DRAFT_562519 [Polyporus arcularius HHB13444]
MPALELPVHGTPDALKQGNAPLPPVDDIPATSLTQAQAGMPEEEMDDEDVDMRAILEAFPLPPGYSTADANGLPTILPLPLEDDTPCPSAPVLEPTGLCYGFVEEVDELWLPPPARSMSPDFPASTYGSCRDENATAAALVRPTAATWNAGTSSAGMLEEDTGPKINTTPVHAEAEAKPDEGRRVVWAQFRTPSIFDLSQSVFFVTVTRQT